MPRSRRCRLVGRATASAPAPYFIQGDPAIRSYRLAHDVLNRGDYGRAAQLFKDIGQKYPKSAYQNDLPYYEACARYKIGTTDELHSAAKLLEPRASKLIGTSTRVEHTRATAMFYDRPARHERRRRRRPLHPHQLRARPARRPRRGRRSSPSCAGRREHVRPRRHAGAHRSDERAQPDGSDAARCRSSSSVLDKKDECSVELRQRAVFMLGRRGDAEAATLLAATAKSDPSMSVRGEAISWLPKLQGDAGVAALEDLLRTEQDENIQRSVVRTLIVERQRRRRGRACAR